MCKAMSPMEIVCITAHDTWYHASLTFWLSLNLTLCTDCSSSEGSHRRTDSSKCSQQWSWCRAATAVCRLAVTRILCVTKQPCLVLICANRGQQEDLPRCCTIHPSMLTCPSEWYLYTCCLSRCFCCKFYLLPVAEQIILVMKHTIVAMPTYSQCTDCNCDLVDIAEQKAETTPIKVAIPTEVNRKAFPESPGGLISPGDNSTVYEPDR